MLYPEFKGISLDTELIKMQKNVFIQLVHAYQNKSGHNFGPEWMSDDHEDSLEHYVAKLLIFSRDWNRRFFDVNPAELINKGVQLSNAEFVYIGNQDSMLLKPEYFSKLLSMMKEESDLVLHSPPTRALNRRDYKSFVDSYICVGLKQTIDLLDTSIPQFARLRNDPPPFRLTDIVGKLQKHRSIILRRNQFEAVGGYCMKYTNDGGENEDFLWKLSQMFKLTEMPQNLEFEVLDLRYYGNDYPVSRKGKKILNQRKQQGFTRILKEDLRDYAELKYEKS